ncbi:MAG: hypothetical protein A3D92_22635 [Bacteroidetes bacterium RIFCSPHIGHO2_02_FULL_44_7]|nr:MAG: hypothetical protein A3D92_22635 [Bacteroidetes bacterium RIFCSPHIGHO2_02_FULL_44_7]
MKRVLFFLAAGLVLFASCRKDRTCICTDAAGNEYQKEYVKISKRLAKADCETYSAFYASCELK